MANLLDRIGERHPFLNSNQKLMDGIGQEARKQMGDLRSTLPLFFAGAAFRLGRLGVLGAGAGFQGKSALALRTFSYAAGLALEVTSYELSHRTLNSGLWKWEGPQGIRNSLLSSALTFGLLRSTGHLARQQNVFLQHFFQDVATLAGQDLASVTGLLPAAETNYIQRLAEIEITNNQMMASLALYGHVLPSAARAEKMWDATLDAYVPVSKRVLFEKSPLAVFSSDEAGDRRVIRLTEDIERDALALIQWLDNHQERRFLEGFDRQVRILQGKVPVDSDTYRLVRKNVEVMSELYRILHNYDLPDFLADQLKKHFDYWDVEAWGPYAEIRFSPESTKPKRVIYPEKVGRLMESFDLDLDRASHVLEEGKEADSIYAQRVDENMVNHLWFYQVFHFAEQVGARVRLRPAEFLLQSLSSPENSATPSRSWNLALQSLRNKNLGPEALQVVEMVIPRAEIIFGSDNPYVDKAFFSLFLAEMDRMLGGPMHLVDSPAILEAPMVIRIPSPSLLEALIQERVPINAPRFFYVKGEVSRDAMMKGRSLGLATVGIVPQPFFLGDVQARVPPWILTLHDIFHAYMSSKTPPVFKQFVAQHYFALKGQSWAQDRIAKYYMGQLVDMNFPPGDFFRGSLRFIKTNLDILAERREIAPADFEEALEFLNHYELFVKQQKAANTEDLPYYAELEAAIAVRKQEILSQRRIYQILGRWGTWAQQVFEHFTRR